MQAAPGRCPLRTPAFDVVFSKDALLHVPDKEALFAEIFRVLKPGGVFAASNWMIAHDGEPSPEMKAYVAAEGLSFSHGVAGALCAARWTPPASCRSRRATAIPGIGMSRATSWNGSRDRSTTRSRDAVGRDYVDKNIKTWEAMQKVLDSGEHRPTHLRGWKPGKAGRE